MKSRILYMYSVFFHLLKARTTMDNIFLSHSYILIFPPKYLFSITLILICITLSLFTLLGNHFSFHFIAWRCKRNVITLPPKMLKPVFWLQLWSWSWCCQFIIFKETRVSKLLLLKKPVPKSVIFFSGLSLQLLKGELQAKNELFLNQS